MPRKYTVAEAVKLVQDSCSDSSDDGKWISQINMALLLDTTF